MEDKREEKIRKDLLNYLGIDEQKSTGIIKKVDKFIETVESETETYYGGDLIFQAFKELLKKIK